MGWWGLGLRNLLSPKENRPFFLPDVRSQGREFDAGHLRAKLIII
jgi:hypothetical protein